MKKKTSYVSINCFSLSQSNYLDGCQIYLLDLKNTDIFYHIDLFISLSHKKLILEKIKSWGESRYFDFHKGIILCQKEKRITISFLS